MLSKNEIKILEYLNENCKNVESCLFLVKTLNEKFKNLNVRKTLNALSIKEYIEVIYATKNEFEYCCIILKSKGRNYKMEKQDVYRSFVFKILLGVAGGVASFVIGKILYLFFK